MRLVFVHGWDSDTLETYGELPDALVREAGNALSLKVEHIHLGRYMSFHDEVGLDDIARAFDHALRHDIPNNESGSLEFSCVTHSTGGPVVRTWIEMFYGGDRADKLPLRHLVMLAPPNHGSALAQLGKGRLGRLKSWAFGKEPGVGVLNWLELGSDGQRKLNQAHVTNSSVGKTYFPFVLTGDSIDHQLYDYLNSYTDERGSDGVVRLASANLNFRMATLVQTDTPVSGNPEARALELRQGDPCVSPAVPFAIVPDSSHTGEAKGIQFSVRLGRPDRMPVVELVRKCLEVADAGAYSGLVARGLPTPPAATPKANVSMIVFEFRDDRGNAVTDYDMLLLAGPDFDPDKLPEGFFIDRQRNRLAPQRLVYFLDHDRMSKVGGGLLGFRITARPDSGFAYYRPAEFRSTGLRFDTLLRANETLYVDVILRRFVDRETCRLEPASNPRDSFKGAKPSGELV